MTQKLNHIIDVLIDDERWHSENVDWETLLSEIISDCLTALEFAATAEISISLANDDVITPLNRDYRGKDSATNSLSFPCYEQDNIPAVPSPMPLPLGDIIIAYDTMHREAIEQEKSFTNHVIHITIHGLLHLLGYDHIREEEAEEMESLEISLLEKFNIGNPYI